MAAASTGVAINTGGAAAAVVAQPPARGKVSQKWHFPIGSTPQFTHAECEKIRERAAQRQIVKKITHNRGDIVMLDSPVARAPAANAAGSAAAAVAPVAGAAIAAANAVNAQPNPQAILAEAAAQAQQFRDKIAALNAANPNAFNSNPVTPADDEHNYDNDAFETFTPTPQAAQQGDDGYDTDFPQD